MKLALGVEYNGSQFHGWQSQQDVITIQETLAASLSKIADEPISIICAGRTDTGVHATHQVVHFTTSAERKLAAWVLGANSHLPKTVNVQWAKAVEHDFHARFSALARRYHYLIYNSPVRSSLYPSLTTWVHHTLDAEKMHQAAQLLRGEHDFSSFRSADCQSRTPKRHIFGINVIDRKPLIIIDIIANSFLHHMVRNIAGVLIDIGIGKQPIDWCQDLLAVRNRNLASKTASPTGLYLTGVRYADHYHLPTHYKSPLFLNL